MGQKVNPHGLRVGVIKDWDSRWFASKATFGDTLVEDYKIRELLKKKLYKAGVPSIEIERSGDKVTICISCAKPGMVIGAKGAEVDKLKAEMEKFTGKKVDIKIIEVKNPDMNAQLVAENIAQQLEGRVSFRRAMKSVIGRTMKSGAKGIKTMVAGRLGGAEIARTESYHEGTIPLQTLRADIDSRASFLFREQRDPTDADATTETMAEAATTDVLAEKEHLEEKGVTTNAAS